MKREKVKEQGKGSSAAEVASPPVAPLRRRPMLFTVLLVVFVVWVGVLLAMYFKTVYPQRHGDQPSAGAGTATRPGALGLPSAPR